MITALITSALMLVLFIVPRLYNQLTDGQIRVIKYGDGSYKVQHKIVELGNRSFWCAGITGRTMDPREVEVNIKRTKEWLNRCNHKKRSNNIVKTTYIK